MLADYLKNLNEPERAALEKVIASVQRHVPSAREGLSYGLPAFKYKCRPLIGFAANMHGLSLYPFDPRIIDTFRSELAAFDLGKGVVRFSAARPIPEKLLLLILDYRINYLDR